MADQFSNGNGNYAGWLGLLKLIIASPTAWIPALFGFFMWMQFQLFGALIAQIHELAVAINSLERALK